MLLFVIVFNLLLALLNFYAAWYFWQLGRQMILLSEQLERLEHRSRLLPLTTIQIRQGHQGTKYLNQQSEKFYQLQLQLKQILLLVNLALRLWQRPAKRSLPVEIGLRKK